MVKVNLRKLERRISEDRFSQSLGIQLLRVKEGYSKVSLTVKEDMLNFLGFAHGGVIFTLADAAFAAACNSYGEMAVALNVEITYMRKAAQGERLFAEAREESRGRKTCLYHMTVATESGELVACCHGLAYRTEKTL